jgi:tetratricopeptide (TPR) repeat protein
MTRPARILLLLLGLLAAACGRNQDWDARLQEIITGQGLSVEQHIEALEAYVGNDPPLDFASEARFTIGWVYAESLNQYTEARRWFNRLLEEDPDGAWAENAR